MSTHLGAGVSDDVESTYQDHLPVTTARYDMEVEHCDKGWGRRSFFLHVFYGNSHSGAYQSSSRLSEPRLIWRGESVAGETMAWVPTLNRWKKL